MPRLAVKGVGEALYSWSGVIHPTRIPGEDVKVSIWGIIYTSDLSGFGINWRVDDRADGVAVAKDEIYA